MSRRSTRKSPHQAAPYLGDSWVVQSDEEESHSPRESDSTVSDDHPVLPCAEASGVVISGSTAVEEESLQKGNSRHSPRTGAGGWELPSLQGSITNGRSSKLPNESVQSLPNPSTSAVSRRKKHAGASTRPAPEPDLVMPSIYGDNLGGSWGGEQQSTGRITSTKARRNLGSSAQSQVAANSRYEKFQTEKILEQGSTTMIDMIKSIGAWIIDVLGKALSTLKTPISFILAGYILVGLLLVLRNLFTSSIYSALSPVCRIPGASFLHLPMCQTSAPVKYHGSDPPPVHFDDLMAVQSKFDAVLEESAGGVSLPLDMKRSEASIRDLRQIVRHSGLRSKNELVLEFDGFIETARIASYDLQKFNSHVGRGVDNILATARWTKRVLDGIADLESSRGAISAFFDHRILAPFQPMRFTQDAIFDHYVQHTRLVEEEIHRLIAEAQALLHVLQNLEDRLDVIHGIAVRDDIHLQSSKADVLSQLWTMVGGNRDKLGRFDSQLRLLGHVSTYRQSAIAYVSGTMIKLQGMGAELEELRERVGGVELLGGRRGVPLSVHIENIELGVERLEYGRNRAKELENEALRKTLSGGKNDPREIEGS